MIEKDAMHSIPTVVKGGTLRPSEKAYVALAHSGLLAAAALVIASGERAMRFIIFFIFSAGFVLLLRYPAALVAAVHALPFLGIFSYGSVTSLIVLLSLLTVAFCFGIVKRPSLAFNLPIMLILLFFIYLVVNWYLNGQPHPEGAQGKMRLFFIRAVIPSLVIMTFGAAQEKFRIFAWSSVAYALFSALLIVATYTGVAKISGAVWGESGRIGLFGLDPISFSIPLGIGGLVAVHFLIRAGRLRQKGALLLVFLFVFFAIFPTGTRQTVFALAVSLPVYALVAYRSFLTKTFAALALSAVFVLAFVLVLTQYRDERFDVLGQGYKKTSSARVRMETMERALLTFKTAPLFGVGISGHGKYIYTDNPYSGKVAKDREHVHNLFVELLAEQGIIGLALFLLPFGIAFRRLRHAMRTRTEDPEFRSHAALLVALLAFAATQANISGGVAVSGAFLMTLAAWASVLARPVVHTSFARS